MRINESWSYDGGAESSGFTSIDLNAGPDDVDWIVVNHGNYEQLKMVTQCEPCNNEQFWKFDSDVLISNKIAFSIVTQRAGDIVII